MTILLVISFIFMINALIVMAAIRLNHKVGCDVQENQEQAHALETVTDVPEILFKIKTAIMPVQKPAYTSLLLRQENNILRWKCHELESHIAFLEQTIAELRRKAN